MCCAGGRAAASNAEALDVGGYLHSAVPLTGAVRYSVAAPRALAVQPYCHKGVALVRMHAKQRCGAAVAVAFAAVLLALGAQPYSALRLCTQAPHCDTGTSFTVFAARRAIRSCVRLLQVGLVQPTEHHETRGEAMLLSEGPLGRALVRPSVCLVQLWCTAELTKLLRPLEHIARSADWAWQTPTASTSV